MAANSEISWTDHTFNPVWGCIKVSPGCENCYAMTWANRYGFDVWGPAKTTGRRTFGEKHWAEPLKWNRDAQRAGKRARVFCSSMADVFEDHPVYETERPKLWALIEQTPWLDWLLLTKRPENIEEMVPRRWLKEQQRNALFGFSAENQEYFNKRWQQAKYMARHGYIVFVSAEPLLGPIDLNPWNGFDNYLGLGKRGWVITGGESTAKARPSNPDWFRSLRDQCLAAGVPFHFKQWGEWLPMVRERDSEHVGHFVGADGRRLYIPDLLAHAHEIVNDRGIIRLGKKAAGRLLDGVEWNEMPLVQPDAGAAHQEGANG